MGLELNVWIGMAFLNLEKLPQDRSNKHRTLSLQEVKLDG